MDKKKIIIIGVLVLLLLVMFIINLSPKKEEDEIVGVVKDNEQTEETIEEEVPEDPERELEPVEEAEPVEEQEKEEPVEEPKDESDQELEALDMEFFGMPAYENASSVLRSKEYDDTIKYGAEQINLKGNNAPDWGYDFIKYLVNTKPELIENNADLTLRIYNGKKYVYVNDYGDEYYYLVEESENGEVSFKQVLIDSNLNVMLAEGFESSDELSQEQHEDQSEEQTEE